LLAEARAAEPQHVLQHEPCARCHRQCHHQQASVPWRTCCANSRHSA
jgi:hypothetical protein